MAVNTSSAGSKRNARAPLCKHSSDKWSAFNIAGVVAGFVFLGPLGLAVLFWVLAGRDVVEIPAALRSLWLWFKAQKESGGWSFGSGGLKASDNRVFNEYQQTQYDRIQEIRDEIDRRRTQFDRFRSDAKRKADEEEFQRFMKEAPLRNDG